MVLIVLVVALNMAAILSSWQLGDPAEIAVATVFLGGISLTILWALFATHYWFQDSALHLRMAMLRWKIPLESIVSVRPANAWNAGTAVSLSLAGLEVVHARGSVLISPLEREVFLQELEKAREVARELAKKPDDGEIAGGGR